MNSGSRSKRIQMMELFSKPQLQRLAKRLVGRPVPKSYSKNDLAKMIQMQGIANIERSSHLKTSNRIAEQAVYQKIQQQNAKIRNLRKQTKNYQPIRPARGYDDVELLLNSIRARNELIARLQRK